MLLFVVVVVAVVVVVVVIVVVLGQTYHGVLEPREFKKIRYDRIQMTRNDCRRFGGQHFEGMQSRYQQVPVV